MAILATRNPVGLSILLEVFMREYPKKILSIEQQLQSYIDAGMIIDDKLEAKNALSTIGYYRLRGYCFGAYDNERKQYKEGTKFSDVLRLYEFDMSLSHIVFSMTSSIEVSLRAHLNESLLIHNDALVLQDASIFDDKTMFWKNESTIANEISRSKDVFINHNYVSHDGQVPIWAAVEVISFGTLSKIIKNLKTGQDSSLSALTDFYKFESLNGCMVKPSKNMLSSWIHSVVVIRNICAHNGRIYNRSISTTPELINIDVPNGNSKYTGLYQVILAMKYLRPNNEKWNQFVDSLKNLLNQYDDIIDLTCLNFPVDWENHLVI